MSSSNAKQHSVWAEFELPRFPALQHDTAVEVVVVGAGITGITTAYLLRKAGVRVALIERGRVASADTGRTTAHLTYVTDQRLNHLVGQFGKDAARSFWEGGAAAIDQIWQLTQDTAADCDFRWVPGYLHAPKHDPRQGEGRKERDSLQHDAELARELGFDAQFLESVPNTNGCGVRFAHQARFHPRQYLAPLVSAIPGDGNHVFENTELEEFDQRAMAVRANGNRIHCDYVVIATHNPLMGSKGPVSATLFQTKLSLYTSYVLGARLPAGTVPDALFWDTSDPYEYLRVVDREDHQYAIFGGEDVKTGQEKDAEEVYRALEARLQARLPGAVIQHRWMGQVIETADGLPYAGENGEFQFIATGFCGNGMTLGTLGAMMARDRYLERENPWFDLLRVDRKPFHGGLWRYVSENVDYPYYLLRDRIAGAEEGSFADLANGEGKILKWQGRKVAAYRSDTGVLSVCSPVCTHLKCLVHWNDADRTWDCPCHGSRFHPDGQVLSGPAEAPLDKIDSEGADAPGSHRRRSGPYAI
jgi:glycine/D-amino acid oxidase-like deaminating enzyme/nitrite reductase/ring-hydroxylating ferredoxin subunit